MTELEQTDRTITEAPLNRPAASAKRAGPGSFEFGSYAARMGRLISFPPFEGRIVTPAATPGATRPAGHNRSLDGAVTTQGAVVRPPRTARSCTGRRGGRAASSLRAHSLSPISSRGGLEEHPAPGESPVRGSDEGRSGRRLLKEHRRPTISELLAYCHPPQF